MLINFPLLLHPWSRRSCALLVVALSALASCQSRSAQDDAGGIVIVNAPVAGEVRRVLVREGAQVGAGETIVEIAVRNEGASAPPAQTEDSQARAVKSVTAAQVEIEAARAEVVRTQVEVQRLTPGVAAGEVPQGELDGARANYERANYERAQQRFQRAQDAAQGAQSGLVAARQPSFNPATKPAATPAEQIIAARASSAGTVRVINARVGDRVTAGQPLEAVQKADS